jgi:hypothetical protein
MKLGPHLCAKFNGIKSPGKQRVHLRRCATCKDCLKAEAQRRMAKRDDVSIREVATPLANETVSTSPVIEAL